MVVEVPARSFSCFFFYGDGDPRDLHSFPTRRSSDLTRARCGLRSREFLARAPPAARERAGGLPRLSAPPDPARDRKSTRLNSSHRCISYAVFCLKKKNRSATLDIVRQLGTRTVCCRS